MEAQLRDDKRLAAMAERIAKQLRMSENVFAPHVFAPGEQGWTNSAFRRCTVPGQLTVNS